MFINIRRLPWITNPHVPRRNRRQIPSIPHHILRQMALLVLVLVMQHEDTEPRLLPRPDLLPRGLDILLQLPDRVLQRRSRVVHLVDDQDRFSYQRRHGNRRKVQPLCPRDLRPGRLNLSVCRQLLIEREPDGLDRYVRCTVAFQERSTTDSRIVRSQAFSHRDGLLS